MPLTMQEIVDRYSYDPETGDIAPLREGRGRKAKGFLYLGHMVTRVGSKHVRMADIAWAYIHNRWPNGELRYNDGDPTNLKLENLTEPELTAEMPAASYRGVSRVGVNKFKAQTRLPDETGKNTLVKYIGVFDTAEQARDAVIAAETAAGKKYERRPPKMGKAQPRA